MMKLVVLVVPFCLILQASPLIIPTTNSTVDDTQLETTKNEMQGIVETISKIKNRVQSMRGVLAGNYTDSLETKEFEESASYETLITKVDTVRSKIKELQKTLKNIGNIFDETAKKYNVTI